MPKKKELIKTDQVYNKGHFVKSYKRLLMSSYWVDPTTGDLVKLTHNLKAVYHYRLEQYLSYKSKGLIYCESVQSVANVLGLSIETVRKDIQPLLIRMGLLVNTSTKHERANYLVMDLSVVKGQLVNPNLDKPKKSTNDKPMTQDQYKIYKNNREIIEKVKDNLGEEYRLITKEEFDYLLNRNNW